MKENHETLVLVNAAAGSGHGSAEAVARALADNCIPARVLEVDPGALEDAIRTALDDGEGIVAVAGGDGTLSTAAALLAGSNTVLAPIPTGTLNHFARRVGLDDIEAALHALRSGHTLRVPVGLAGTPAEVAAGKSYNYTITTTNVSELTLDNVAISESVPAGLKVSGGGASADGPATARFSARPIHRLSILAAPLVKTLTCSTDAVLWFFGKVLFFIFIFIWLRGSLPRQSRALNGDWLFGCDICQEVCPWNRHAPIGGERTFAPAPEANPVQLAGLFALAEEAEVALLSQSGTS